jgi:peptidoglycan/xylan/chitin deacetylase (PgdA/CDA1 family)
MTGVDIDAVAGWLGSYGGEDSSSDISRGLFAGTVGVQRLLKLFDKYDMKATWFIPGHTLETFPEDCAAIRDRGHEIGLHGYRSVGVFSFSRIGREQEGQKADREK